MRIVFLRTTGFIAARAALSAALPHDTVAAQPPGEPLPDVDVIVPGIARVDGDLLDEARPLAIHQFGVGLDGVDIAAATERKIPVARVPGAESGNAGSVAELVVLHLLALTRRYAEAREAIHERRLGEPVGESVDGMPVAIVGLGATGRATALRLAPFGVRLIGVGRRELDEDAIAQLGLPLAEYLPVARLQEALWRARAVVLCCPLDEHTRGLIGAHELAAMPRGSYLINVARGPIVERAALLAALRSGQLAGAGLDVFWEEPVDPADPLLAERVTLTPHVGGVTRQSNHRIARRFAENVERLRRGEPLHDRVA
ncbi:MAG: D-isomer specific 2-hydroxyacid dehydrogenase, NAD-binding [Solirubrobacterales bacterium]|nr:D-isomer specific 2-hydroxyacid dehydrogenase, NAD-binding [Solirubrobacterales bacterium]